MTKENKIIMQKLNTIESELNYIKQHMVDADMILTDDDLDALKEGEKEFKEGKAKRLK